MNGDRQARDNAEAFKGLVWGLGLMVGGFSVAGLAMERPSLLGLLFVAFLSAYLPVSFVRERRRIAVEREAGWPTRKAWQDKKNGWERES